MGRRGPPKTPTKLRVLRGETRPSQINRQAPMPKPGQPVMPADMDARATAVWKRVIKDFGHTGVITGVDVDALRCYCEAVGRYEEASRLLRDSGPLIRGARRGDLVRNPLHQIMRDNADLVRIYARELGLTPAARVGLKGQQEERPAGKLDKYLA